MGLFITFVFGVVLGLRIILYVILAYDVLLTISLYMVFKSKIKRRRYTDWEVKELMRWYCKIPVRAMARRLNRSEAGVCSKARKLGLRRCNPGMFKKGHKPWNTGLRGIRVGGNTKFKKGHIPYHKKSDNTIVTRKEKNIEVNYIKLKGVWVKYSRYIWNRHYGNIKKGYVVRHKDGNSLNDDINNLEVISMAENMKRNINNDKRLERLKQGKRMQVLRRVYGYQFKYLKLGI